MSDVRAWLEELGLGEYAEAFARERVDLDAARHLTDEDLRDLGLPLGPRKKILAALPAGDHIKDALDTGREDSVEFWLDNSEEIFERWTAWKAQ